MKTALVLGGAGQIGYVVACRLAVEGWRVTAARRSGRAFPSEFHELGIRAIDAAGRDLQSLLGEVGGSVDVLVDPLAFDADDGERLLAVQHRLGALVVLSSASVYCDAEGRSFETQETTGFPQFDGSIAENRSTVPAGADNYSARKRALEDAVLRAEVPALILRPAAIHGQHGRHPREWWFIKRGLDRRPHIPLAYDGRSRFGTTAASSIASLIAIWLRRPDTVVLNVADRDAPDVSEIAAVIGKELGLNLPIRTFAGKPGEKGVGASPWSIGGPFVLDCSRAEALGWTRGTYAATVAPTLRWIVATVEHENWQNAFPIFTQYGYDPFDYAAEDAFLDHS